MWKPSVTYGMGQGSLGVKIYLSKLSGSVVITNTNKTCREAVSQIYGWGGAGGA